MSAEVHLREQPCIQQKAPCRLRWELSTPDDRKAHPVNCACRGTFPWPAPENNDQIQARQRRYAQARKFVIQERYIEWRVMYDDARPNQKGQQFVNDGRELGLPRRSSQV